jgi:hypothetical protein
MSKLNVDRMRRYRQQKAPLYVTCATCREILDRMEETEDYTSARFMVGAEHFGHVMRDHRSNV